MTSALKMAHGRCSKLILIFGHGNDLHVHIIVNISVHRVLCEVLVDIDVGNNRVFSSLRTQAFCWTIAKWVYFLTCTSKRDAISNPKKGCC